LRWRAWHEHFAGSFPVWLSPVQVSIVPVNNEYHLDFANEIYKKLKEKNDLFIITARDENLSDQTFLLIKEHFPESFRGVHFLHKNSENILGDKGLVCTDLAIDIFIEDSLKNATHTGEAGVKTLLFDAPWNRINVLPENVKRVFSWEEIIREIEALEEN
jgi:uncharacterized HAD superfamily protein